MSNAVRSTSGTQGAGGLASGGSSSRAAPADGVSFGGVLGQAMAGPAHPATGAGDGNADGKSDGKDAGKDRGNPVTTADATAALAADLAPTVAGSPATGPVATTTGKDAAPGATGGSDKKRRTDAAAANPAQSAQAAAVVVASLVTPVATGTATPTPTGAAAAVAVGAATAITNATTEAPGPRVAADPATAKAAAPFVKGANALTNHELVGPEDGTGSQEPDGIGPATATVGRPAAMNSGVTATLSSGAGPVTAANAPASGSGDHQPGTATVTDVASAANAQTSTMVLATLATADRDPNQASPNGAAPASVTSTGGQTVTPGVFAANLTPLAMPNSQTAPVGANSPVNAVAPDGTNQPLANALGTQILSMVAAGRNQLTVHLSPPDLGALTVHVEVQSRDVSAWFASPQPQVQQAVTDALAQLHGSLGGAGLNLSGAWVGADVSGGGNGRPAAAPLPARRTPTAAGRVEATAGSTNSVEGLSVYA